jgi:hypothetical protein
MALLSSSAIASPSASIACGDIEQGPSGGGGFSSAGGGGEGGGGDVDDEVFVPFFTGTGERIPSSSLTGYWAGANGIVFTVTATESRLFVSEEAQTFQLRCYWRDADASMSCNGPIQPEGVFPQIPDFNMLTADLPNVDQAIAQPGFRLSTLTIRTSSGEAGARRYYRLEREMLCKVEGVGPAATR